jgi:amino acid permease
MAGLAGRGDLSEAGAVINILKGLIGMGILSLPYATMRVGWLPSILGMVAIAGLLLSGIFMVVLAKARLANKALGHSPFEGTLAEKEPLTASEGWAVAAVSTTAEEDGKEDGVGHGSPHGGLVCSFDQTVGELLGGWNQVICALSLVFGQWACGMVYVKVIAESLGTYWPESFVAMYLPIGFVLAGLCLLETLKRVTYLSAAGLGTYVFILIALVVGLVEKTSEGTAGASAYFVAPRSETSYGTWFGCTAFAFGGLPIAILVYDDMREPQRFIRATWVGYTLTWLMYTAFAMLGYFSYGKDVEQVIYMNFGQDSFWRHASLVSIVTILAFTFVLQQMPTFAFAHSLCQRAGWPFQGLHYSVVRFVIVWSCVIVAWLMPSAVAVIDTFGAITTILSGMIYPAVLFWKVSRPDEYFMRMLCVLLVALGVFGTGRAVMGA